MSKPGYVYLAQSGRDPNVYRFGHTEDRAILSTKTDKDGFPIIHAFAVLDMWGIEAFLFGYFHRKFVEFNCFSLCRGDIALIKILNGQTIDQVACQMFMPEPEETTEI